MPLTSPLTIPWGDSGRLDPRLPDHWDDPEVVEPDLTGVLGDYPRALASAMEGRLPGGWVGPRVKVAIVVDDPSRWTPVREALPLILERLRAAGVPDEEISLSVGVGRHHAVDDTTMRKRLGDAVVDRYRCFSPSVDDLSAYLDLGRTPRGVPVRVFRPVAEAGLRVLVGSVLPHLQAGFGGGYKLIFPGTSHRSTLGALHRQGIGRGEHSGVGGGGLLGGDAGANPMRQAIREAAGLLGPCLSVSHLLGAPGEVLAVRVGHPDEVQDALAAEARRRFASPVSAKADIVAAGNYPWPGDPLQSFKVLLQHRQACRSGGVLAGFFWTDPAEMDRSFPLPALRAIAATGAPGGWAIRRGLAMADRIARALGSPAAFMLHWARELVVDRAVLVYAPPLFNRLGPRLGPVLLFDDPGALWRAADAILRRQGVTNPRLLLFPKGGLTYAGETRIENGQALGGVGSG